MRYCLFVREDLALLKEAFFDDEEINGMKSDTYMYKELKQFLATQKIDLNTQYINKPEEADVIICLNETNYFVTYQRRKINQLIVLILTEPPVYNAVDWTIERHVYFDKVFSYDSDLLKRNSRKYKHINFPINFNFIQNTSLPTEEEFNNKKLSSLVAGAIAITKGASEKKSLLFERYKILKWYSNNSPTSLDFYARINPRNKFEYFRGASFINKINKKITIQIASYLFEKRIAKVYRGAIPSLNKNSTLSNYKFNFCIENSHSIKGLISEKIFDCFMSKTIPIYYGAPDIEQYIPKNCFIAYTDFKNLNDLNIFLNQLNYNAYLQYLINANKFLANADQIFSTKTFVTKVYQEIKL